jgi:propionate CoA-transferase
MRLTPEGVVVTEIAPGIDVERDILAQAEFPLRIAENATAMPGAIFRNAPLDLPLLS